MPKKTTSDLTNVVDIQLDTDNLVATYICENTDRVLESLEQIKYSLNQVQVAYDQVVILKKCILRCY